MFALSELGVARRSSGFVPVLARANHLRGGPWDLAVAQLFVVLSQYA